ncbi:MAG: tetratricopeptide repeat protein, partial [Candidatus Zixiibacteriota bacterium]
AAFGILSILSGGIFLYNIIGIIGRISPAPHVRLLGLFTFLFSGTILLFFGYVEFYPVTWAAASIFLNLSFVYLSEKRLLMLTSVAFIATILMHVEAIFLLPGVAVLLMSHIEKPALKKACFFLLFVSAIALGGIFIWLYQTRIEFEVLILPPFHGWPVAPEYTIFSSDHLIDILNILFLIFPGWLSLLVFIVAYGNIRARNSMTIYLAALSVGSLLFLALYGAAITMGRDWDIFSLALFAPGLLLIKLISDNRSEIRWSSVAAYVLLTGFLTICFLGTAILKEPYEKRFQTLLNDRNDNGWAILANYYHDTGREKKSKEIIAERMKRFPQLTLLQMAYNFLDNDDYENARKIAARLVEENPFRADFHQILGNASGKLGDFEEAEKHFNIAVRLKPYNPAIRNEFGRMYLDHKDYELALAQLSKAFKMAPEITSISESMALCYIYLRDYDSAGDMADYLFEHDPNSPGGHLINMVISINTGDIPAARQHYLQYKEYGQDRPDYQNIIEFYKFLEN